MAAELKMAVTPEALSSIRWFMCGFAIIFVYIISYVDDTLSNVFADYSLILLIMYTLVFAIFLKFSLSIFAYEVAIRSFGLGVTFGVAILISLWAHPSVKIFGWYLCLLSFFHISEYITTAMINPRALCLDSFLINHSREYTLAAIFSWAEFWIEWHFFPVLKLTRWASYIGILMCVAGEVIRKLAMFTAKTNFNHVIQVRKESSHVLVTSGIYNIWRHPSYVGWFWWSVGTQIVMCNPICLFGYVIASWNFFNERIYEEEITLLNFFGKDYFLYQTKVPTGLPFITGFRVEM